MYHYPFQLRVHDPVCFTNFDKLRSIYYQTLKSASLTNGQVIGIDVGQWLVSGLQRPSSVRQSLAVRQKELSEKHRITLKRQKCIENKQNLCNFPFFLISFSLFSIFPSFFFIFSLFFFAFFLYFSVSKCTTEMNCTTKWAFN